MIGEMRRYLKIPPQLNGGIFFAVLLVVLTRTNAVGQNTGLGVEYKLYPAGQMLQLQAERSVWENRAYRINLGIGINRARRGAMSGLNQDERGTGPGLSSGLRYYLKADEAAVYLGLRNDLWWIPIDWYDPQHDPERGQTSITVLQPTVELGYRQPLAGVDLFIGLVNGFEINAIQNGKEVGQGWITELQLAFMIPMRSTPQTAR